MPSNLSLAQRHALEQRRQAYQPQFWMALSEWEALELSQRRVPGRVRSMARWLAEPLEAMLARTAKERERHGRTNRRHARPARR